MSIKIMTYNIRHGKGLDNRQQFLRITDLVRNTRPDILGINELDCYNPRSKLENQPRLLADTLGYEFVFHPILKLGWALYGNGLFSRWPIVDYKLHRLPGTKEPRGCIEAKIQHPQGLIRVITLHLGLGQGEQEEQLTKVALIVGKSVFPTLVTGDFNRTLGSEVGVLGLLDTYTIAEMDNGNTFPANNPTLRIDYILCTKHFQVEKVWVVESQASDHLPVVALVGLGKD